MDLNILRLKYFVTLKKREFALFSLMERLLTWYCQLRFLSIFTPNYLTLLVGYSLLSHDLIFKSPSNLIGNNNIRSAILEIKNDRCKIVKILIFRSLSREHFQNISILTILYLSFLISNMTLLILLFAIRLLARLSIFKPSNFFCLDLKCTISDFFTLSEIYLFVVSID